MNPLNLLILLCLPFTVAAGGTDHHEHRHEARSGGAVGHPGKAEAVNRTLRVDAGDDMRFQPGKIAIKAGETIRFVVRNAGKVRHEFMLGDAAEQAAHADMMRKMPDMVHEEANALTLEPGQEKALIWRFTEAGEVEFACHVPGHYEAGMKGAVSIAR
ncbi:MAG: cupredoxin family protein [Gammaproteobacteria bacterium]|nr:cupredoxin family protein [Gammaproteobacteria bacterium]